MKFVPELFWNLKKIMTLINWILMTIYVIYYIILIYYNAVFILNNFLNIKAGNLDGKEVCIG